MGFGVLHNATRFLWYECYFSFFGIVFRNHLYSKRRSQARSSQLRVVLGGA